MEKKRIAFILAMLGSVVMGLVIMVYIYNGGIQFTEWIHGVSFIALIMLMLSLFLLSFLIGKGNQGRRPKVKRR